SAKIDADGQLILATSIVSDVWQAAAASELRPNSNDAAKPTATSKAFALSVIASLPKCGRAGTKQAPPDTSVRLQYLSIRLYRSEKIISRLKKLVWSIRRLSGGVWRS